MLLELQDVRVHYGKIEALKGIGVADNKLMQASLKSDHHSPGAD